MSPMKSYHQTQARRERIKPKLLPPVENIRGARLRSRFKSSAHQGWGWQWGWQTQEAGRAGGRAAKTGNTLGFPHLALTSPDLSSHVSPWGPLPVCYAIVLAPVLACGSG